MNKSCISIYGYSEDEFLNLLTINDLRPREDALLLEKYLKEDKNIGTGGIWRHIKRNGEIFYVRIYSYPTRLNGFRCRYIMAVNVEKEVQLDREIREQYFDLRKLEHTR